MLIVYLFLDYPFPISYREYEIVGSVHITTQSACFYNKKGMLDRNKDMRVIKHYVKYCFKIITLLNQKLNV